MRAAATILALVGLCSCGEGAPNPKPTVDVIGDTAQVGKTFMGAVELNLENSEKQKLSAHCGSDNGFMYVDTLRPVTSTPPLHGVYGQFVIDGRSLPPTELGWGSQPPGAWTAHDRNPIKPLVRQLMAAKIVTFSPPKGFGDDASISWTVSLSKADRDKLKRACAK